MLVILDRDGVINHESHQYIKTPEEWHPISGSLEAIVRLKQAGFLVAIATNQSGIARGLYTEQTLQQIHAKMLQALSALGGTVDGIFYCPHHPEDHCLCRKPNPGLLHAIRKEFKIALASTVCIGDSLRDIQAAQAVQAKPILVLTGNGVQTQQENPNLQIPVYPDLATAVSDLLA